MQSTVKVKVQLLKTLDDGSVDPNCYACKMGQVILTSDGKISSESPAVKDKRLLIKKNGKVDNRSAICKKTVDQDRTIPISQASSLSTSQASAAIPARDNMDSSTLGMQQPPAMPIPPDRKPVIHASVSPAPSAPPISMPDTVAQATMPIQSSQLSSLSSLPPPSFVPVVKQSLQPQGTAATHRSSQPPQANHQERSFIVPRGLEQQVQHNNNGHSVDFIFSRAGIPRNHEFACALYPSSLGRSYFTYNFMCFLQRLFHRPVDTEEESFLGLQPLYNCLKQEAKDVLTRNLPGCEKELVLRLMGQSIQLMSPSALSVINIVGNAISEDKPFTNACQTLYQLSRHVKNALLATS